MLSDEEKEAIEYIKNCLDNEYNYKNATRQKDKKAYNIILNLIEKQQKEKQQKEKHIKEFTVIEHFINKDFNIECGLYHITTNNNKFYITQTKDDFKAIVHCSEETELAPIRENIIQEIRELLKKVGE